MDTVQYWGDAQGLQPGLSTPGKDKDRWIQGRTVTLQSHFVVESFVNLRHPSSWVSAIIWNGMLFIQRGLCDKIADITTPQISHFFSPRLSLTLFWDAGLICHGDWPRALRSLIGQGRGVAPLCIDECSDNWLRELGVVSGHSNRNGSSQLSSGLLKCHFNTVIPPRLLIASWLWGHGRGPGPPSQTDTHVREQTYASVKKMSQTRTDDRHKTRMLACWHQNRKSFKSSVLTHQRE